jgi:dihydrofolate reductase
MAKIVITTNSSLDGVVQDPDGAEGAGRGGWFDRAMGGDRAAWAKVVFEEALAADALLLGRRSDQWFASRWLSRGGPFADRLNSMPKYVVSATLDEPAWSNATVLGGIDQVAKLKEEAAGEVLVYASYQLGRALLERDLVDEVRLVVLPVVVGAGTRLFADPGSEKPLHLLHARTIGSTLPYLTYQAGGTT